MTHGGKDMRIRLSIAALALLLPAASPAQQAACGVERWNVKILRDRDTARVDLRAVPTTVAALGALPAPAELGPANGRLPLERRTFRVRAFLAKHASEENDGDIHLVLSDVGDRTKTMIAEIPDSACALGSRHASRYAEARRVIDSLPGGIEVEIEGVAFFDRISTDRPAARPTGSNCIRC